MQLSDRDAERMLLEGVTALRSGDAATARARFAAVTDAGRADGQSLILLAMACRGQGDRAAEEATLDTLLRLEPRTVRGRIMKGDCRVEAGDEGSALGFYSSALQIADGQELPADLMAELRRVEAAVATLKSSRLAKREATLVAQGLPPEQRSDRFQASLDILSGAKQIFLQEPTGYYFPGLPQIQFFDLGDQPWVKEVEAATDAIRDELETLLTAGGDGFRPYLRSDANRPRLDDERLQDSMDWSALFLCENGETFDDAIARCPLTWDAVQAAPLPRMANSPTVMFSWLRPGARIAPHTGTHNTRLTCHLPLIVPPGCGFRVGNEVREWQVGKLMVFDDSIEHEAWNESGEDRLVLIFDIWRPELSEQERREVGALFYASSLE
ncbi:aspartyl/asparaginyl beta-hydroxylase domain-containing protein [Sphingomonas sp. LY160]|uniref:aspartyl/asparaginyl beta-hydroxylase domain-containing protein n=1 Tax=Sphingomonas sp. LY160 TaxID=3095342 RepID=UPI002ADEE323|nr:aspartyl/asparaginyl beta-hydroxylase domain-containing protein [Sphingomonas sp. LY160]MEA1072081.1 aspartyl/asparaginyl beta-hydroxylase domain-containing protein [Sphingomonas sp. LY160]